jgi:hypothetical protein
MTHFVVVVVGLSVDVSHLPLATASKGRCRAIFQYIDGFLFSVAKPPTLYIIRVGIVRYNPYSKEPSSCGMLGRLRAVLSVGVVRSVFVFENDISW